MTFSEPGQKANERLEAIRGGVLRQGSLVWAKYAQRLRRNQNWPHYHPKTGQRDWARTVSYNGLGNGPTPACEGAVPQTEQAQIFGRGSGFVMSVVKRIVCLANSRKMSGRCVAGKELVSSGAGPWLRPVSDRPSEEVSEKEREYKDGSDPQVLDIIDVPLKEPHPKSYQTENWLLDPKYYWERAGQMAWKDLAELADDPAELWINGQRTGAGLNDRVRLADAGSLKNSLYLLHPDKMKLRVFAPGADFGNAKRRVQADFAHRGVNYRLWVTDPIIEKKYLAGKDGDFSIAECFITVSLGEPHEGYCYKLVATVISK